MLIEYWDSIYFVKIYKSYLSRLLFLMYNFRETEEMMNIERALSNRAAMTPTDQAAVSGGNFTKFMTVKGLGLIEKARRDQFIAVGYFALQAGVVGAGSVYLVRYMVENGLTMNDLVAHSFNDPAKMALGLGALMSPASAALERADASKSKQKRALKMAQEKWVDYMAKDDSVRAVSDPEAGLVAGFEGAFSRSLPGFRLSDDKIDEAAQEIAAAIADDPKADRVGNIKVAEKPPKQRSDASEVVGVLTGLGGAASLLPQASGGVGDQNLWDAGATTGELYEPYGEEYGTAEPGPADSSSETYKTPLQLLAEGKSQDGRK
jgi:hypothetical protein